MDTNAILAAAIPLTHNVKFYVPSTVEVDQAIDASAYVQQVEEQLARLFGGATAYPALGVWLSEAGKLVTEKVVIVQSFADETSFSDHLAEVVHLAGDIKEQMSQESVAVEIDNKLYLF